MKYWYEHNKDNTWTFCYEVSDKEERIVEEVMPEALKVFRGDMV